MCIFVCVGVSCGCMWWWCHRATSCGWICICMLEWNSHGQTHRCDFNSNSHTQVTHSHVIGTGPAGGPGVEQVPWWNKGHTKWTQRQRYNKTATRDTNQPRRDLKNHKDTKSDHKDTKKLKTKQRQTDKTTTNTHKLQSDHKETQNDLKETLRDKKRDKIDYKTNKKTAPKRKRNFTKRQKMTTKWIKTFCMSLLYEINNVG